MLLTLGEAWNNLYRNNWIESAGKNSVCVYVWLYKRNAFTWQSNFFKLHYSLSRSLSSGSPLWWAGSRKEGCTTFIVLSTQFCINYEELLLRSNQIIVYVLFACDKGVLCPAGMRFELFSTTTSPCHGNPHISSVQTTRCTTYLHVGFHWDMKPAGHWIQTLIYQVVRTM